RHEPYADHRDLPAFPTRRSSDLHALQRQRDNPECADAERDAALRFDAPGLQPELTFDPSDDIVAPYIAKGAAPRVAILREQGVRSEEHTSELQSRENLVCRLLLE